MKSDKNSFVKNSIIDVSPAGIAGSYPALTHVLGRLSAQNRV